MRGYHSRILVVKVTSKFVIYFCCVYIKYLIVELGFDFSISMSVSFRFIAASLFFVPVILDNINATVVCKTNDSTEMVENGS